MAAAARPRDRTWHPGQSRRDDRHPSLHFHRHGGIKFGDARTTRWATARGVHPAHPDLRLTGRRDAPREPAARSGAVRRGARQAGGAGGRRSARSAPTTLESVDIGGGLGIRYRDETPPGLDPAALAAVLAAARPRRRACRSRWSRGASWSASAGVLLTQVLYRKHSGGQDFVVVDAGMNDLVRPSHYKAYHDIVELVPAGRPAPRWTWSGPICESGDFLALERRAAPGGAGRRARGARRRRLRVRHGLATTTPAAAAGGGAGGRRALRAWSGGGRRWTDLSPAKLPIPSPPSPTMAEARA